MRDRLCDSNNLWRDLGGTRMIRAVVDEIADLPASLSRLYAKRAEGPLRGKFVLAVEPSHGVELLDVEPLRKEEARLWSALQRKIIDDAITEAVDGRGGNRALLQPHIAGRARVDRATLAVTVLREDGQPLYNNKGLPASIDDLVADLKKHPDYGRAFAEDSSPEVVDEAPSKESNPWGHGTLTDHLRKVVAERVARSNDLGHVTGNPFRRDSWNLTQQGLITRADPTRAAQLRAAAEGGAS